MKIKTDKRIALYRTSDGHAEVYTDLYPRQVFWDLFDYLKPTDTEDCYNVLILAGDMFKLVRFSLAAQVLSKVLERFDAVAYIPGNHEYYGSTFCDHLVKAKALFSTVPGLHFLDNSTLTIDSPHGDVAIVGSTLWADLSDSKEAEYVSRYLGQGVFQFKDFKVIRTRNSGRTGRSRIKPCDLTIHHRKSVRFIFDEVDRHKEDGKTVVVATHHSPSLKSASHFAAGTPEKHKNVIRKLNAIGVIPTFTGKEGEHDFNPSYLKIGSRLYVSDLDEKILEHKPDFWVHGHIHDKIHYRIGETDISSDPQGYLDRRKTLNPVRSALSAFFISN
ncbi:metallophosphoesterase [Vibrio splendidus]|nr:metallophosphoesterase [Vibrio splendidus]MCC4881541.1 metallophosphoesterase [Vibrio splendidus]